MLAFGVGVSAGHDQRLARDVRLVLGFALQIWMYVTPVIYAVDPLPDRWRRVGHDQSRRGARGDVQGLLGIGTVTPAQLAVSVGASVAILVSGLSFLTRLSPTLLARCAVRRRGGGRMTTSLLGDLTWEELASDSACVACDAAHFRGDVRTVQREAYAAASEMGRVARVVRDDFRKHAYVWVQFLDYQVPLGDPSNCEGRELIRTHEHYGAAPPAGRGWRSSRAPSRRRRARRRRRPPSSRARSTASASAGCTRLDQFTEVRPVFDPDRSDETEETWYGRRLTPRSSCSSITYPLIDGARQPHPDDPDEELLLPALLVDGALRPSPGARARHRQRVNARSALDTAQNRLPEPVRDPRPSRPPVPDRQGQRPA